MTISDRKDRPRVAVVGSGPAGLMAAETAAAAGAAVTVFERMASPARKLLLAGRGGLNLTHSEPLQRFVARYRAAAPSLEPSLAAFGPDQMVRWCADLGIQTFVGSSGRVFPSGLKTSPLLRAWLRRLDSAGVVFRFRHRWSGWDGDALVFDGPEGRHRIEADATVLALGGASWPHLGSDGTWVDAMDAAGVAVEPLAPSNCGFRVAWSEPLRTRFAGAPLKSIRLAYGSETARGDLVITREGIEGGPIYALSGVLRRSVVETDRVVVDVALRPDISHAALVARLNRRGSKQSFSTAMRKTLGLAPVGIALLRDATTDVASLDADALARLVNAVPLRLGGPQPIARAISSAGGIRFEALDEKSGLQARPGTFPAGEMLDWDAPTGGYLLQACFATGAAAGQAAARWAKGISDAEAPPDGHVAHG